MFASCIRQLNNMRASPSACTRCIAYLQPLCTRIHPACPVSVPRCTLLIFMYPLCDARCLNLQPFCTDRKQLYVYPLLRVNPPPHHYSHPEARMVSSNYPTDGQMSAWSKMRGFVCGLVDKMFPSPPPTVPSLLLVTVPSSSSSSSSCHNICFSSCCIPLFPKRIPTCGFDELTYSHTLLLSVPFSSLSQPLFFFSVPQPPPPSVQTDICTQQKHTWEHLHKSSTHAT